MIKNGSMPSITKAGSIPAFVMEMGYGLYAAYLVK